MEHDFRLRARLRGARQNQEVVAALRQVAGVRQAHACWGQPDVFAFVEVGDDAAMVDTVLVTIQAIPGVRTTETHLVAAGVAPPSPARWGWAGWPLPLTGHDRGDQEKLRPGGGQDVGGHGEDRHDGGA